MRTTDWGAALVAAVVMAAAPAGAQEVDTTLRDLMHARSYGMGGAYRAAGLSADVVTGNPAAMSLFQRYQTELAGSWEINGRLTFGTLSIMDSLSNRIAAGISYHFASIGTRGNTRSVNLETLAIGMPVADWLHFGLSVRHMLMFGAERGNAVTGDAGLAFRVSAFHLALGAHNVIDTTHQELARYYSFSGAWVTEQLTVAADARVDFGAAPVGVDPAAVGDLTPAAGFSVGAEYIFGFVPIRAGYSHDAMTRANYVSAGIGLMTQTGNIDFAYRHQINGLARLISISVRLGQ